MSRPVLSSADLNQLRNRVGELQAELRDAEKRLTEAELAACEWQPDDVVEVLQGYGRERGWVPAIVRNVQMRYGSANVWVSLERKAGGWMNRETQIWNSDYIRKPQ